MTDLNRRYVDRFKAEEAEFNKLTRRFTGIIITVWVVGGLASLAVTGTVIWAIVKVVQHFTA